MFGLGFTEILLLALIAFLVFGPEKFPQAARNFIKLLNELSRAWTSVKSEFDVTEAETRKHIKKITDNIQKDLESVKDLKPETQAIKHLKPKNPSSESLEIKKHKANKTLSKLESIQTLKEERLLSEKQTSLSKKEQTFPEQQESSSNQQKKNPITNKSSFSGEGNE